MMKKFDRNFLHDARVIITDPAQFADRPALRCFAWAVLRQARGMTPLRQVQLDALRQHIQFPPPRGSRPRLITTAPKVAAVLAARMMARTQDIGGAA